MYVLACVCFTGVVVCLQVHVTQLVDVADVHLLLVDLRLIEVLWNQTQTHKHITHIYFFINSFILGQQVTQND